MQGFTQHDELQRSRSADSLKMPSTSGRSPPGSDVGSSDGEAYVEVTIDINGDQVSVIKQPSVPKKPSTSGGSPPGSDVSSDGEAYVEVNIDINEDQVSVVKQPSVPKANKLRIKSLSAKNNRMATNSSGVDQRVVARARRREFSQLNRTRSGAERAIKGLRFISSESDANNNYSWNEVESNFEKLAKDGLLCRSDFALCIGMNESKEFAMEIFDTLRRRRRINVDKISKDEMHHYWTQINDQSFDSRLQFFFDMVDKNGDGQLGEEEIKEIIMLSASACKLPTIRDEADEYASLIMEELDPDELGYVELWQMEALLLQNNTYLNYSEALNYVNTFLGANLHGLSYRSSIQMKWTSMTLLLKDNLKRTLRLFRSSLYNVRTLKVNIYKGGAMWLQISKPPQFRFKSGQYLFIKCPAISFYEWHPFWITSSPGDDYLSIHLLKNDDWTKELHRAFTQISKPSSVLLSRNDKENETPKQSYNGIPKLWIDGPYGGSAQDYSNYDVVVFAGFGTGVAPFISILKDLTNNIKDEDEDEDDRHEEYKQKQPLRIKNAYFYWITSEQRSFEWFHGAMNEAAELDNRGVIEMHNYLTSVYEEGDARSAIIKMIAALNHAKYGIDIISGTKVLTRFGKPNWRKILSEIGFKHANTKIGVFCCGAPILLAKELRGLCHGYNQRGANKFEFHQEYNY